MTAPKVRSQPNRLAEPVVQQWDTVGESLPIFGPWNNLAIAFLLANNIRSAIKSTARATMRPSWAQFRIQPGASQWIVKLVNSIDAEARTGLILLSQHER